MIRTLLIASALVSCVSADDPELGTTEQEASCPIGRCGGNSPLIGPLKAEELNEVGLENASRVRVLGFIKPGTLCSVARKCRVDVRGARIYARAWNGTTEYSGADLVNGYIQVWQPGDTNFVPALPAGEARINFISHSWDSRYWQYPKEQVESFELGFEIPGIVRGPLCNTPPSVIEGDGSAWLRRFEAFFYTGDRYNHDTMTVTASTYAEAGDWFNIACSGSATAKLLLNRHTTSGKEGSNINTTRAQRQTMLKMYTGDFCGTGTTYTVQGAALAWATSTGLGSPPSGQTLNSFESYWNENGALCMTRHRLASSTEPESAGLEAMVRNGSTNTPSTCRQMPLCSSISIPAGVAYMWTASPATP